MKKKKTVEFRDIFMLEEKTKGEIENQVKLAALYRTNINTLYLSILSAIVFLKIIEGYLMVECAQL